MIDTAGAVYTSLTEAEVHKLIKLAEGKDVVELGAQFGGSTLALAISARSVHSLDWHQGDEHAGYRDTLHEYFYNIASCRNVVSHIGRFEDILPKMRRGVFDMAFIDGQHDRVSVKSDYTLAQPLLKPGATVAFHDYGRFEVKEAVDSMFKELDELVDTLAIVTV
jgi:predicted O-methyltransferase YrrM